MLCHLVSHSQASCANAKLTWELSEHLTLDQEEKKFNSQNVELVLEAEPLNERLHGNRCNEKSLKGCWENVSQPQAQSAEKPFYVFIVCHVYLGLLVKWIVDLSCFTIPNKTSEQNTSCDFCPQRNHHISILADLKKWNNADQRRADGLTLLKVSLVPGRKKLTRSSRHKQPLGS